MKSKFLFLLLFVSSFGFSQSINNYAAVIIPLKYDFIKEENQYRLSTLTKFNLQKAGFKAFYSNENLPQEYSDRCNLLNIDVLKDSGFLTTKLYIVFKDCNGKEIFKSEIGKSKEKDFALAYTEALNNAFLSVYALHYKYDGKTVANNTNKIGITAQTTENSGNAAVAVNVSGNQESSGNVLFAQPIQNGFQLIDNTPKVVMKIYKTTNVSIYLAVKDNLQGIVFLKDNQWFFEYYEKEALMSEKIKLKF